MFRKDRATSGGGVLIAVKDEFNCEDAPELDSNCELVWAKVKLIGNGTLYLCSYYRHYVSDEESVTNFELSVLRACSIRNASIIIGGDFNFPGWDWTCNTLKPRSPYPDLHNRFYDILADNALTQLVLEPTRKANTLDLLLTNQPDQVLRVDILPGISDHDIVFAEMDFRPDKHVQKPRLIPLYKKANWGQIKEDMKSLNETLYFSDTTDVNTLWEHFKDNLHSSLKSHIPHRRAKTRDGYPWIGPELKKMLRKQHRLYKLKKKTGDPTHKQRYLEIKHLVQRRTRQAYWMYVESIVTPQDGQTEYTSMKRFWTFIKHKRSGNVGVSSLKKDGKLFSHPSDKAEILNNQFQSVFTRSDEVSREDFIHSCQMLSSEDDFPVMDEINITENGITKLLKNLNPSKSPGPDNLGPRVLKELADDIAPILLLIFRRSLASGEVPADWRTANVAPVFKKGQKYLAENYRPISLTSVCCKIMEHILASNIMSHGENNSILYPLHTCDDLLMTMWEIWISFQGD